MGGGHLLGTTESKSEITFNHIHKPSGKRVRYQKVVPGTGEIDEADIVKGYQVEPNVYVTLEPEEVQAIRLESKKTIDMKQFIDASCLCGHFSPQPGQGAALLDGCAPWPVAPIVQEESKPPDI